MSVERLLTTVLRLYQDVHDDVKTDQIYSTTTTLLTHLSNPLNLSLLTSQLLTAPAIWNRGDRIRTAYRIISVYNTAAMHVRKYELEKANNHTSQRVGGGLSSEAWARAVIKGADDRSSRWQHVLVLSGVLMGFEANERQSLGRTMRNTLERAIVTATNLALRDSARDPSVSAESVVLALNYVFPLLSESSQYGLEYDALIPLTLRAMFAGEGLEDGLFLGAIDVDVQQSGSRFMWLESSPSFLNLRRLEQKPLVGGLGPLSRLTAHAIGHARDSRTILQAQDALVAFSGRFLQQWQANKLSELEISEESVFLTAETLQGSWPVLWQFLKRVMYAVVAVLQAIVSRSLLDAHLRNDATAPIVATKTLRTLRNLYFISSQHGSNAFQVYTFTYLASIDNLACYAEACVAFLQEIRPVNQSIPVHPLHRTLDLFYLNVAEHLPLSLPPEACNSLIVQPASVYLTHSAPLSPRMVEIFEAAHSAILSVLSCPHNAPITAELAPFYAESLFTAFPSHISPRQFRFAFKTLMQILAPPFPISASHPHLPETLLEMVRFRAGVALTVPLPPAVDAASSQTDTPEPLSEQSVLVLTLIDSLPFLHLNIFEDWLGMAAMAVNEIQDPAMREPAKRRFWQILAGGEMDVERAAVAVAWWGTKGGREMLLYGNRPSELFMMSGAIANDRAEASRL
ncbi:peroxisomal membrane protein PEX17 [Diplogelasinospora grovesii]|uniref:Peroxisomal membrane protein PEX17 n=1 Tax=Diplogelasinospora grovesii TaxID=303347 RepID=A0AAN6NC42_9PEZI|nr:peroxisomal membrane protein PEX17 [Diplogelasinospora grovesii]